MSFPQIQINLEKIQHNSHQLVNLCKKSGIEVMGVTKGVCAMPEVVNAMVRGGIEKIGDSRIQNIIFLRKKGFELPLYLIRIPMLSEAEQVVDWADGSLNSEIEVIKALSRAAVQKGKSHKIILMIDVGDLREGVLPEDTLDVIGKILNLPGIIFEGIGTNLGCYGGVLASLENTKILVDLARKLKEEYGIKVNTLSGGNSSTLPLLLNGRIFPGINQFRLGEGILLGNDPSSLKPLPKTYQDAIELKAEVIEVKTKPSYPIGEIGRDAFGNIPVFEDKGIMKRAIVALGRQDCQIEGLICKDKNIEILGASSDHLLLDITKAPYIKVGSIVDFQVTYGALANLMVSKYVDKNAF